MQIIVVNADVAELADAQDLKSCGWINRAGSIPAICTIRTSSVSKDKLEVLIRFSVSSHKRDKKPPAMLVLY